MILYLSKVARYKLERSRIQNAQAFQQAVLCTYKYLDVDRAISIVSFPLIFRPSIRHISLHRRDHPSNRRRVHRAHPARPMNKRQLKDASSASVSACFCKSPKCVWCPLNSFRCLALKSLPISAMRPCETPVLILQALSSSVHHLNRNLFELYRQKPEKFSATLLAFRS